MTDDNELSDPKGLAPDLRYGESLLYDFAKFLTTLSLLALGGVLSLTQTQAVASGDVKLFNIILVVAALSLAGLLAMLTANSLASARAAGVEPRPKLHSLVKAAMALLAFGTGAFLMVWLDTLT